MKTSFILPAVLTVLTIFLCNEGLLLWFRVVANLA